MAEYKIREEAAGIALEVSGTAGRSEELLAAFQECQEGRCTCPTNEYQKVASMEVRPQEDRIAIRLEAKPETRFDLSEIAACLDYTTAAVDRGGSPGSSA